MTATLLDTATKTRQTRRADAERQYLELLQREGKPKPGDDERLADVMEALGLDDAALRADVMARRQVALWTEEIVPPDRVAELDAEAARAQRARDDGLRAVIHSYVDKLESRQLWYHFGTLGAQVLVGNAAHADAAKLRDDLERSAMLAQLAAQNAAATNKETAGRIEQTRRAHPLAFGLDAVPAAPAPAPKPAAPTQSRQTMSGGVTWVQRNIERPATGG